MEEERSLLVEDSNIFTPGGSQHEVVRKRRKREKIFPLVISLLHVVLVICACAGNRMFHSFFPVFF